MRRWVTIVLVLLGCGGNEPAPGTSTTEGTPKTGEAPTAHGLDVQRDAIAALVKSADAAVDLAAIAHDPYVVADVSIDEQVPASRERKTLVVTADVGVGHLRIDREADCA